MLLGLVVSLGTLGEATRRRWRASDRLVQPSIARVWWLGHRSCGVPHGFNLAFRDLLGGVVTHGKTHGLRGPAARAGRSHQSHHPQATPSRSPCRIVFRFLPSMLSVLCEPPGHQPQVQHKSTCEQARYASTMLTTWKGRVRPESCIRKIDKVGRGDSSTARMKRGEKQNVEKSGVPTCDDTCSALEI